MALLQENGERNIHWIKGKIILEYENEDAARAVFESINVDNYQYVHCSVKGRKIICEARAERAPNSFTPWMTFWPALSSPRRSIVKPDLFSYV